METWKCKPFLLQSFVIAFKVLKYILVPSAVEMYFLLLNFPANTHNILYLATEKRYTAAAIKGTSERDPSSVMKPDANEKVRESPATLSQDLGR